jgi:hypothetical protein
MEDAMKKLPMPVCVACKHHDFSDGVHLCVSPRSGFYSCIDGGDKSCIEVRYLGGCGAAGQWFEPKDK